MRNKTLIRLGAALALLSMLAGCGGGAEPTPSPSAPAAEVTPEIQAELDAQLGLLTGYITEEERQAALELWLQIRPLREARLAAGQWAWRPRETTLLTELSALYDGYTIQYLGGDEAGFGYANPEQTTLISYSIGADGALIADPSTAGQLTGWTEEELMVLWRDMTDLLPEGAFADFGRLTFFTDGPEETVAWVQAMDEPGDTWEIAVDPADAGDRRYFVETILHEYCHYLTLNSGQVTYTASQTVDTYNEYGMVAKQGSYIDDFYQAYWTDYLDDCLSCGDTYNFFLRHYDDFVTAYASTDPSEDICEAFAFFVLRPRDPAADTAVWSQKLDFFYNYPELTAFRDQVRSGLGLAEDEWYEDRFPAADSSTDPAAEAA